MTDGVPQIQLHPGTGVKFVLHDHVPLQFHAAGDDRFPVKGKPLFFQMGKQLWVVQHAVLDNLGAAVSENVRGEGI